MSDPETEDVYFHLPNRPVHSTSEKNAVPLLVTQEVLTAIIRPLEVLTENMKCLSESIASHINESRKSRKFYKRIQEEETVKPSIAKKETERDDKKVS